MRNTFVNDLMNFVIGHDKEALKRKVQEGNGKLSFKLNGHQIELVHGEDFFFSANERAAKQ